MIFGYVRVSTKEENQERQIKALLDYEKNLEEDNIYTDKQSGKDFNRKNYLGLKEKLRKGDTLIIKELDRFGRNKSMVLDELNYYKALGVRVKVLDVPTILMDLDSFGNEVAKAMIDMINNLLIEVLSTISEQERIKIKQRQAEGIAIAKREGKYKGRKAVTEKDLPKNFSKVYKQWKNKSINGTQFAQLL
ncbi:Site-specific DNA recombinase [Clostridium collagenovorans DSM 3089]|uniref:Site-specific DNA recombinase n=1 Tax=Clostridium collagenovorans DSM 3089 TaxID=1121306 RepID=A0A1M5XTK4_9CLOT|nr:recombinase family protein [Clostridium collagenovorans]SHI02848.1 Site-specific DNA recombinase [Clostridium collagenovorans DSM 3089]